MGKNIKLKILFFGILIIAFTSCKYEPNEQKKEIDTPKKDTKSATWIDPPSFNRDSAFYFVAKQVAFGPRVPGTKAHKECAEYLVQSLQRFGAEIKVQSAPITTFDKKTFDLQNIVATFSPEKSNRVLLCAHWDTRPFADQEADKSKHFQPIDGANDGASGVGVLLEIARQISIKKPDVGVDIILFDLEDYGQPAFDNSPSMAESYCLGSQYWARNLHVPNYKADFGILLDMVGAPGAIFTMEGTSMYYAAWVVQKVWAIAHKLGFESYFKYVQTQPIIDDHLYINKIANIPTIDIIQYDPNTSSNFGAYWHTHDDKLENIDRQTLYAVGQTVLGVVYNFKK